MVLTIASCTSSRKWGKEISTKANLSLRGCPRSFTRQFHSYSTGLNVVHGILSARVTNTFWFACDFPSFRIKKPLIPGKSDQPHSSHYTCWKKDLRNGVFSWVATCHLNFRVLFLKGNSRQILPGNLTVFYYYPYFRNKEAEILEKLSMITQFKVSEIGFQICQLSSKVWTDFYTLCCLLNQHFNWYSIISRKKYKGIIINED